MEEIILTGYSSREFAKILKKKEKSGCYLCKRRKNEKSVYISKSIGITSINIQLFEVKIDDLKFVIPLCQECHVLIWGILNAAEKKDERLKVRLNFN